MAKRNKSKGKKKTKKAIAAAAGRRSRCAWRAARRRAKHPRKLTKADFKNC